MLNADDLNISDNITQNNHDDNDSELVSNDNLTKKAPSMRALLPSML